MNKRHLWKNQIYVSETGHHSYDESILQVRVMKHIGLTHFGIEPALLRPRPPVWLLHHMVLGKGHIVDYKINKKLIFAMSCDLIQWLLVPIKEYVHFENNFLKWIFADHFRKCGMNCINKIDHLGLYCGLKSMHLDCLDQ